MRVVSQSTFGGPDVLTIVEAPRPSAMATEIVVRVEAVGLNPLESRIRSGEFPFLGDPPFVLGWDVSGVVVESRSGRFSPGDEVFGMPWFPRPANAYAEYVSTPALNVARKPVGLSHAGAAALPVAGLTAWQGLNDLAGVTAGDRVLVHAGAGGVGHLAIQIAKSLGAYVLTTCSSTAREFVGQFGPDEVIEYDLVDFDRVARDVDVVLDTVGGDTARRSRAVLRPGGHLVTAVAEEDDHLIAEFAAAGLRFSGIAVDPDPVALAGLTRLVDTGALRVHVDETFAFHDVVAAHERLDRGHLRGKLVLTLDHDS